MPRSIWNGTITLGLIAVPIKVYSATENKTVHFHQVHAKDGARIRQKRMCSQEHREVPYKEVAKGYEVGEGRYVLLSQEEINAAAGDRAHEIALEEFVAAEQIDPIVLERTYYLGAGVSGQGAYRLLHDALGRARRVGIGRWVFHNREYLVSVRATDGVLTLHTMHFATELVDPAALDLPEPARPPTDRELEMAGALLSSLEASFEPSAFQDTYRERVLELIDRKARGEEIAASPPAPEPAAPDLLAALEASLTASGSGPRGRGSSAARRRGRSGSSGPTSREAKATR